MKHLDLGPDYESMNRLFECVEGSFLLSVDTESMLDSSVPGEMKHLGADLYVPINMQAFDIPVEEVRGVVIAGIEVNFVSDIQDFEVSTLVLTARNDEQWVRRRISIDGKAMRSIPIEKYKRRVIETWMLRDMGRGETPRWRVWNTVLRQYGAECHSRGANLSDLMTVARIYVSARYGDKDAHEAVAHAFKVSKSTAGRWIKKARDIGYLENIPVY